MSLNRPPHRTLLDTTGLTSGTDDRPDVSLLPLPVFSTRRVNGDHRLVPANNHARRMIHHAAEQAADVACGDIFDSSSATGMQKIIAACLSDGVEHQYVGNRLASTGSEAFVARISRIDGGSALMVIIPADLDPTAASSNDVLAEISHDLRTPLNSIIGFAEMMSQEVLGPLGGPAYREYASLIGKAGNSILERFNQGTERERLQVIQHLTDYEQIIELAPDMICICVNGRISRVNAAGIAMLGMWDDNTLVGRPFSDFVLDDYKDIFGGNMEMLLAESTQVPVKLRRGDGQLVDAEVNVLPFKSADNEESGASGDAVILAARDVTQRQRSIETILEREELLRQTMDTVNDAIFVIDETGTVESVNAATVDIFGYSAPELIGRRFDTLIQEMSLRDDAFSTIRPTPSEVGHGMPTRLREMIGRRKGDEEFPVEVSINSMIFAGRHLTIGSARDISERQAYERELQRVATTNPLTGMPNRYMFEHYLDDAIDDVKRNGGGLSVMSCDLNAFKSINDALGHVFGDKVLKAVAERIALIVGDQGLLAHFGSDDFFILITEQHNRDNIESLASTLCEEMAHPLQADGKEIFTSCTIGICHYPSDASNRIELMQHTDTVTHYAKKYFAGNYAFYAQPLSEQAQRRHDIERNLRRAIERNELSVLYQPKVDLMTRRIIGAEALLRWTSKDIGFVPPDEFIVVAEQTGLIIDIGQWVLNQVCLKGGEWQRQGLPKIHLGVNLSAVQFLHGDLVHSIHKALLESSCEPQRLDLELTESMLIENPDKTIATLLELKKLGLTVSMDDFGTGYSALSMLTRFPLDTLKVDRAFVMNLPDDRDAAAIARTIISMAQQLNLSVVAEGIETESQMTFLNALGCDIGQGYLFGKPMPAEELAVMISDH